MTLSPDWTGPNAPDRASLPHLDALEAFDAMRLFLERYWEEGDRAEEEIRRLLSALNRDTTIWPEGGPADPAMWPAWIRAVEAINEGPSTKD